MISPFGNALVTMLKFTSLVSLVTIQDLSFRAESDRDHARAKRPCVWDRARFVFRDGDRSRRRRQSARARGQSAFRPDGVRARRQAQRGHLPIGRLEAKRDVDDLELGLRSLRLADALAGIEAHVDRHAFGSLVAFALGLAWTLSSVAARSPCFAAHRASRAVRARHAVARAALLLLLRPADLGRSLSALATGVFALGLYYSATASEIYRAGIEDLPNGQWEAAQALSLPLRRIWIGLFSRSKR